MDNLNPGKYSAPRSYNANTFDERMGFAMRDQQSTDSVSQPTSLLPLGKDVGKAMMRTNSPDYQHINYQLEWDEHYIVPGIMSFAFEPVIAPQSWDRQQIVTDIFVTLWSAIRTYYTGAESIQPADISIISTVFMEIEMWVEYIRRALDVMKITFCNENAYIKPRALLTAMGLDFSNYTDFEIQSMYTHCVNFFNQEILGKLNAKKWLGGIFPGEHRWASLCREFYKDESIDSQYVQLYMFYPRSFYRLVIDEVTDKDILKSIKEKKASGVWRENIATRAGVGIRSGIYAYRLERIERPTDFIALLNEVKDLIMAAFYDDSAILVQNCLDTITQRGHASDINVYDIKFDLYPLEGRTVVFTYDWSMLLAIHNATVMYGLRTFDVTQDPASGRVVQQVGFDTTAYSWPFFTTSKVVNLPNFCATAADYINATQWTISADENAYQNRDNIDPSVLGTDVLVDATLWKMDFNDNSRIYGYPLYQYTWARRGDGGDWPETTIHINVGHLRSMMDATAFNMHPLWYVGEVPPEVGPDVASKIIGITGELDVLYYADYVHLAEVKEMFVKNFWGYPLKLKNGEGKFDLPNNRSNSPTPANYGQKQTAESGSGNNNGSAVAAHSAAAGVSADKNSL